LLLVHYCFSQLEVVSILREPIDEKKTTSARTSSLSAMRLPFWDDFSFNVKNGYPNDTLWEADSKSVWVNNGSGINPPSVYVATFDGNNLLGKPYSPDPLAKGNADVMTSRSLKLGDVAQANRATVFMSFFYQFSGNGDAPEAGDILSLLFKNDKDQWIEVWSKTNDGTLLKDKFDEVPPLSIQALEKGEHNFFHNDFQFRFQSFGRLSGPYDVWHVDYVYVNQRRSINDTSYPDRAITNSLTSLFDPYFSVPLLHLGANPVLAKPFLYSSNNRRDFDQSFSNFSLAQISNYKNGSLINKQIIDPIDNGANVAGIIVVGKSILKIQTENRLSTAFDLTMDSIKIKFKIKITSGDLTNIGPGQEYDPLIYAPIDFRRNDTLSTNYLLSNYYAYDDGVAEYGLKTIGKDTEVAYQFDMKTTAKDNIIAFDIYFPKYSDTTNQTITLFIAKSLTGSLSDYLYQQSYAVKRTSKNKFSRFKIPIGVEVQNQFYVGWRLNSEKIIPVGLDRNNDSGSNIFSKVAGSEVWVQNTSIYGSIMLRPVFGIPDNPTTSVEKPDSSEVYPNPSDGVFYLPIQSEQIQLYDLAGRQLEFQETTELKTKQIKILNPTTGLFLVRYFNQYWHTEKIIVKP
jgi:hypothetical protein